MREGLCLKEDAKKAEDQLFHESKYIVGEGVSAKYNTNQCPPQLCA